MPLHSGTRIGPYEVTGPLGAGGMGEVYRARDSKLNREVALKVLPESLSADAEYLARFQREAQALAALNHPNIAQIYGLEESTIVMELVAGDEVRGPLPEDEALSLARQIADALAAAHEKGIIHRDLKPANIKVTPGGVVKVLDFGLAKTSESATSANSNNSPTLTMRATQAGVILGTAAYMSPEQARGKPVDKRTDIWAFGVVLYEILTGRRMFEGETISDVLAGVLKNEPDLSTVSRPMRRVLERCLRKDPKLRLRDIGDVWLALEEPQPAAVAPAPQSRRLPWPWIGALACALSLALAAWFVKPKPDAPVVQTEITLPPGFHVSPIASARLEFSPDGRSLVLPLVAPGGKPSLWMRSMDTGTWAQVPGTENLANHVWSPDGRWLAFLRGGSLYKLDFTGGQPQRVADTDARGALWLDDDMFLLYGGPALLRVPVTGGKVEQAMPEGVPGPGIGGVRPVPGEHQFLYSVTGDANARPVTGISSFDGRNHRVLFEAWESPATYAVNPAGGPGWIFYIHDAQLTVRPFNPARREFTGDAVVIASGVPVGPSWAHSQTGLLAFRRGATIRSQLTWYTRDGKAAPAGESGFFASPRISPDGKNFAVTRTNEGNQDIWLYPLSGGAGTRLTFETSQDAWPLWSADGRRIIYFSNRPGGGVTVERPVNGGPERVVATSEGVIGYGNFSPDGRWLLGSIFRQGRSVVALIPVAGGAAVLPNDNSINESAMSFSPDGHWTVYQANPSGVWQVYVRPAPPQAGGPAATGATWQVSSSGGAQPRWSADGKEIFYVDGEGMMIAVAVESAPDGFHVGKSTSLFRIRLDHRIEGGYIASYDVTPDGKRFLVADVVSDQVEPPITVVSNFPRLLTRATLK